MKKYIIVIVIILIILSAIFFGNKIDNKFGFNGNSKIDIEEEVWFKEEKAAFIKVINKENILSVYNNITEREVDLKEIVGDLHSIKWSKDGKYLIVDEGSQLINTTYIVDTENMVVADDIKTIGEVIWSPDSKKLLIGAENNKERVVENELFGTVDLAIYYLWSKKVEPFLEAASDIDYYPEYWDEDNTIGYLEIKDKQKEKKTTYYEISKEERAMEITKLKEVKREDVKELIGCLKEIDVDKLEDIYGEGSGVKVFHWLYNQEIKDEEDIISIIKVLDKLYRDEYEEMTKVLAKIYEENTITFIKALSKVPEYMEELGYAFHFLEIYDEYDKTITADLNLFLNSEELTEEEKKNGIDFLNIYTLCGT